MSAESELRKAVWHSMLRSQMNALYWQKRGYRFYNCERIAQFFLLATSSSAVAGWGIWIEVELAWKMLSGLAALMAIALPLLDWSKHVKNCADLYGRYMQLTNGHDKLWRQVNSGVLTPEALEKTFDMLSIEAVDISMAEATHSVNQKLLRKAYNEVINSRGLSKGE